MNKLQRPKPRRSLIVLSVPRKSARVYQGTPPAWHMLVTYFFSSTLQCRILSSFSWVHHLPSFKISVVINTSQNLSQGTSGLEEGGGKIHPCIFMQHSLEIGMQGINFMSEENITNPFNVHRKQGESTNWYAATWHELAAACQYRNISSEGIQGHLAQKTDITRAWMIALWTTANSTESRVNIGQTKIKYSRDYNYCAGELQNYPSS